jgi:multidrug efflux pump
LLFLPFTSSISRNSYFYWSLSIAGTGSYINDFIDRRRVKPVYMQGDAQFRKASEELNHWYVRSSSGMMAPMASFTSWRWGQGSSKRERYNGLPSLNIQGQGASSYGTGDQGLDPFCTICPKGIN